MVRIQSWIRVCIMLTITHLYRSRAFQFRHSIQRTFITTPSKQKNPTVVNPFYYHHSSFQPTKQNDSWKRLSSSIFSTNTNTNNNNNNNNDDGEWNTLEEEEEGNDWRNNNHNLEVLPKGVPDGFYIIQQYSVPMDGFSDDNLNLERIEVDSKNVTLPLALTILDPQTYPSFSRARKACRYGTYYIILYSSFHS